MEEVIGVTLRFIFHFIAYFVVEILFQIVFLGIGWFTLKIITFGKYPDKDTSENFLSYTGVAVSIIFITTLTICYYIN